jgi:hypothetical protein
MKYHATVPLGRYEAVGSADGISTTPTQSDSADITVKGPRVTVIAASTGVAAEGVIDSAGRFVAFNRTDYFAGSVDATGNIVISHTSSTGAGGGHLSAAHSVIIADPIAMQNNDYTAQELAPFTFIQDVDAFKRLIEDVEPEYDTPREWVDPDMWPGLQLLRAPEALTVGVASPDGPA